MADSDNSSTKAVNRPTQYGHNNKNNICFDERSTRIRTQITKHTKHPSSTLLLSLSYVELIKMDVWVVSKLIN